MLLQPSGPSLPLLGKGIGPLYVELMSAILNTTSPDQLTKVFGNLLFEYSEAQFKALSLSSAIPGNCLVVNRSSYLGLIFLDHEFHLCLFYWLAAHSFKEKYVCVVLS